MNNIKTCTTSWKQYTLNGKEDIKLLRTKLDLSELKTQLVQRSKHSASVVIPDQLKLYREIIDVFSEIHTNT
jgi:hypothetical protein